jgi:hypothetical protein
MEHWLHHFPELDPPQLLRSRPQLYHLTVRVMKKIQSLSWYTGVLIAALCLAAVVPWLVGGDFYMLGLAQRPFHALFHLLKPSGRIGHLYGIAGSLLIIIGVIVYTSRKRLRSFSSIGKLKYFLEFHITVCLVGPLLVLYHSSFKLGGIVGVGFWSMTAVVASGIVGRYLWAQIPKGIRGHALSIQELEAENTRLLALLKEQHEFSAEQTEALDRMIDATVPPRGSALKTLWVVVMHDLHLFSRRRKLSAWLSSNGVSPEHMSACVRIAVRRSVMHRRMLFLEQLRRIFQHWHVVHVPFTVILLVIFLVHVGTAILFGYVWGG